jgi:threonine aldolase
MDSVDLRSDTVSHPTPAMREAMALAPVGDDVYGEDPTINRLQEMAAQRMGKEAGLFVASGTMGNLAAVLSHCRRGDEVILGKQSHIFLHEAGGISALGGVHSSQIPNQADGILALQDILDAIRDDDAHEPVTRLVTLENTHNACGGVPLTPEYTRAVGELVHAQGLALHLDGARIFNASVAQEVDVRWLVEPADSITFCLSKGLCAPVGSVLCGSSEFIARAHRIRKLLGGGMRQAGVLAAAGIVALETMVDRLSEDHKRARALATGLGQIPGVVLDPGSPYTNMVFLSIEKGNALQVCQRLFDYGIKVVPISSRRFRLVTHYWVDDLGIERTVNAFRQVLSTVN